LRTLAQNSSIYMKAYILQKKTLAPTAKKPLKDYMVQRVQCPSEFT